MEVCTQLRYELSLTHINWNAHLIKSILCDITLFFALVEFIQEQTVIVTLFIDRKKLVLEIY